MQILMSKAAYERVAERLKAIDADLDILTMASDGGVWRGERLMAEPLDPEVFWISLDMYQAGLLAHAFGRIFQGSNGRWLQVFSAGLDNPAFKSVMEKGVRIAKSDAQSTPIAEFVMAHALSLLHPIARQDAAQKDREWTRVDFREIAETRWLMVGYGAIGREIAKRLKPFEAALTVVRRKLDTEGDFEVRPPSDLLALLPTADVVVLACALNDKTRGMADMGFFEAMKTGSIFINIARGGLVDEDALKAGVGRRPARACGSRRLSD